MELYIDELYFFWLCFHLIPSLYEDFISVWVRSDLLLPKKWSKDFVPSLETRIGWDFLCVFALCCWERGFYWVFLAFVLIPFPCCEHCCQRFLVLSHFVFVNRFLFFIDVPWWWSLVNDRRDHFCAPSGQCCWTYGDPEVMTDELYSLAVIQV